MFHLPTAKPSLRFASHQWTSASEKDSLRIPLERVPVNPEYAPMLDDSGIVSPSAVTDSTCSYTGPCMHANLGLVLLRHWFIAVREEARHTVAAVCVRSESHMSSARN